MKRGLAILSLFSVCSLAAAQEQLAGKYVFNNSVDKKQPFFKYSLSLNCDSTFLAVDSATNSSATGTWSVKKKKKLVLHSDSVWIELKKTNKHYQSKVFIKPDGLHSKVMSRRQYKKLNRMLEKGAGEAQHFEEYDKYKKRQESNYLKKLDSFDCL